jgi:sugar transferase (PEP-CTERM/EpsH1 system associated)
VSDTAARPDLLFLCHRIPFPPDKGDKIRSYRWLIALGEHYKVHLVAFVDDPQDWIYEPLVQAMCRSCRLIQMNRRLAALRSGLGMLTGEALSLPYYQDRRVWRWLDHLQRTYPICNVLVYSSAMAPYVMGDVWRATRRVIDLVDVDSDKWRQYAANRKGVVRWLYRREAKRLARFEALVSRRFDLTLLVSPSEVSIFQGDHDGDLGRVDYVSNGVDHEYFAPVTGRPSPYSGGGPVAVFTGAMDYWANADAVSWFVAEVWPLVRAKRQDARLFIVGSNPNREVAALGGADVIVTGRVPDIRPYLQYADVVVAPLRIARGIQNKVLEGMAMARPVIVTGKALEGIDAVSGRDLLVADSTEELAGRVLQALAGGLADVGRAARELVVKRYSWNHHSDRLLRFVAGC